MKNEKYLGHYKNKYIDDEHYFPAIINKELFEKVQQKLPHNKRFSKKTKENFLLSGKLLCGHCGANMIGTSGTSHTGKKHTYYACINHIKHHTCDKSNENKQKLEDEVFCKIYNKILQKDKIEEIADGLLREYEKDITYHKIKDYESKIANIEKEFDKITSQIIKSTNDNIIKRLNQQANDLTDQQEIYKTEIKKLNLALQIKHTKQDIIEWLSIFLGKDPQDEKFRKDLFDLFISAIYVFDDYLNVYVDLFNMNAKITFDEAKEHKNTAEKGFLCQTECSTNSMLRHTAYTICCVPFSLWFIFVYIFWVNFGSKFLC